jgi:hypothetical protein
MKSELGFTALAFLSAVSARKLMRGTTEITLDTPGPDIINWNVVDFEGSGCDKSIDNWTRDPFWNGGFSPSPPGPPFVLWDEYFTYPDLHGAIGPGISPSKSYSSCTATVSYILGDRFNATSNYVNDWNVSTIWRPVIHLNGTRTIAGYNLDAGVTADWTFTYYPDGQHGTVSGSRNSNK